MSFASDLKKEILADNEFNDDNLKAELYGILKLKSEIGISLNQLTLTIKTTSLNLSRRIIYIIKKLYSINIELISKERKNLDKKNVYVLKIADDIKMMLADLAIMGEDYNFIDQVPEIYKDYTSDIVRGMFLAAGSMNDPSKSKYHLEIACNEIEECVYLKETLKEFGIDGKISERRDKFIFYIKKGEQIGDFLKVIGATSLLFDFENERIKKDLNNSVNRVINCDLANGTKTRASCDEQLENIKIIKKYMGFESLSVRLMEAITLRVKNPDASLQELSDISYDVVGRNISKSGISHCMKDLELIAETLKNKNTEL